jgi:hypothetical protein
MKITKAKLIKGTYLEVSFDDDSAVVNKSYPHTDAPPRLLKAFMSLNHHLCELTEQYDSTGQLDFDNVVCRGYSMKGEGEKEGFSLTGIRTLSNGRTLTIPKSPFLNLESDDSYGKHAYLVQCLDKCREEIMSFMENNKSSEEIQGKLFDKNKTFIVQSEKTAQEEKEATAVDIIFKDVNDTIEKNRAKELQDQMNEDMPLTQDMIQANNARKKRTKK